jgi:dihydroorotate dehydrogenase
MGYRHLRPALFALEPERAHRIALRAARLAGWLPTLRATGNPVELMGLRFPNRVGLAAGLDKNAAAVDGLGRLGFGFIEVGTVTPRPQPGRSRPRLFRIVAKEALINRMGFPNIGAQSVVARLQRRRYRGILGVNIGKNADTPLARAVDDYVDCLRMVGAVADYVAINISSPNTASLRDLQSAERLEPLLGALLSERDALVHGGRRPLPLLLKISPDLDAEGMRALAQVAQRLRIDGLIVTNTTLQWQRGPDFDVQGGGGLSGAPLHALALSAVCTMRTLLGPDIVIIGVGGVDSEQKALAMRRAGADLVQIYTGLIYQGPALVRRCAAALSRTD